MTDTHPELAELRDEIDRVDEEIGGLVAERIEIAERVAAAKSRSGTDLVDEGREESVKSHYAELFREWGSTGERGRELAAFLIDVSLEREESIETES